MPRDPAEVAALKAASRADQLRRERVNRMRREGWSVPRHAVEEATARSPWIEVARRGDHRAYAFNVFTGKTIAFVDTDHLRTKGLMRLNASARAQEEMFAMPAKTATPSPAVAAVLREADVFGEELILPGQLDRALYLEVDKLLQDLRGRWDKKRGAHVFPDAASAARVIAAAREGAYESPKANAYFATPDDVAAELLKHLHWEPGMWVLEPSAGEGHLADAMVARGVDKRRIVCCEIREAARAVLTEKGYRLLPEPDFLALSPHYQFGRVVMNPPFDQGVWQKHVVHAWQVLKRGGRLLAVVPVGWERPEGSPRYRVMRELTDAFGHTEELWEEAFAAQGTTVRCQLLLLIK